MARASRKTAKNPAEEQQTLSETLFGLDSVAEQLLEAFHSGRQHHAVMLSGQRGVGKASLATQFARYVLEYGNSQPEMA
jgi:DNA polymerase-3 subunit delta'